MHAPMRIFIVTDLKADSTQSIRVERRRWPKGFVRLGHDVHVFSFRDIVDEIATGWQRSFHPKGAFKPAKKLLLEHLAGYRPDLVLMATMKDFSGEDIKAMRVVVPKAVFVGRDVDPFPKLDSARMSVSREVDLLVATNGGRFLQDYKDAGAPKCAFLPCPCDPDIQRPYPEIQEQFAADIVFTGQAGHRKFEDDKMRTTILHRLSTMPGARLYGCLGRPRLDSIDTFMAISAAKIALSVNAVHDVRLYHSDRIFNCVSCGPLTLASYSPDSELLLENKKHVVYFRSVDEFFELADYYLKHDSERCRIALAGMERAHKEFNCTKMAQYMLDIVERGSYDAPWATIL